MVCLSLFLLLFLIFTTGEFRFEAGNLFLLQTEFEKYRSIYMGRGYLLAFSANTVTHLYSCKNRISENFAGFSKIFNMCFFTIYSCEAGDLLPYQVEFFSCFLCTCWNAGAGLLQSARQLALVVWVVLVFFSNLCVLFVLEK